MATKLAQQMGGPSPHSAGIFADMTVDGPKIGTLVLIVDRAKNLPNRKSMGKQNPYCAARLGKEANKTETDRRGGQTPRWDQELRFTVHDSPDYHNLKISVFSEDRKTDLIGEAWVSLESILLPGGGKCDLWQTLNCKGKYAGDLRIELTYYDSRPKPERTAEAVASQEDLKKSVNSMGKVKRRPLPSNPNIPNNQQVTPETVSAVAAPGRAKHGPRDLRTPLRANSMPPETTPYSHPHPHPPNGSAAPVTAPAPSYSTPPVEPVYHTPPNQYYEEREHYSEPQYYEEPSYQQPQQLDLLPELPPSNRQRARSSYGANQEPPPPQPRAVGHIALPQTHSSPALPLTLPETHGYHDDGSHLRTDYPETIADLDYQHQQVDPWRRRSGVPSERPSGYGDAYANHQPYVEEEISAPPPPPVHSHSAPVVPHGSPAAPHPSSSPASRYPNTPPHLRTHSVPNSSPLQSIETAYGQPQRTPPYSYTGRGRTVGDYNTPSPEQYHYDNTPPNGIPGSTPSPYARAPPGIPRGLPNRHSIADPYNATTPPRPHPLSQEVSRARSPNPYYHPEEFSRPSPQPIDRPSYQHEYRNRDAAPLIKPRALSPQPPHQAPPPPQPQSQPPARHQNPYSLQHPIRAFESSDASPLSTSRPPPPTRKSVSPRPTAPNSAGTVPFSPDSFDIHNPNARPSLANGNSPRSPYQIHSGSEAHRAEDANGPIKGWHGQEIDPSDHLPVDSWAPEPEKKIPNKTYGLGRDRDFGPRTPGSGGSRTLSKDTMVNFRMKTGPSTSQFTPSPQPQQQQHQEEEGMPHTRNRLQKKSPGRSPVGIGGPGVIEPLRERHNYNSSSIPNPYDQPEFSRDYHPESPSPFVMGGYGGGGGEYDGGHHRYPPPQHSHDALAREISSIDIGSGAARSRPDHRASSVDERNGPAPTAFVPVRSHKDRRTYY